MSSIIDKLGIKPIESHPVRNGFVCDTLKVRIKEKIYNEMLEALIGDVLKAEKTWLENWLDPPDLDPLTTDEEIVQKCQEANKEKIKIVEKACYPKKWEEIKELL